jgi:hypothetical protein
MAPQQDMPTGINVAAIPTPPVARSALRLAEFAWIEQSPLKS